jgi:hypothetical protein
MNRSIPLPTHQELATLTAAIASHGSPREKAEAALALWEAAGEALESRRDLYARALDEDRQRAARVAHAEIPESGTVSLDDFLAIAMPKAKAVDRAKAWRDYLAYPSPGEEALSGDALQVVRDRYRANGFPAASVPVIVEAFAHWKAGQTKRNLSKRGAAGAAGKLSAKKGLEATPTPEKRNKQEKAGAKQKAPGAKQARTGAKQRKTGI